MSPEEYTEHVGQLADAIMHDPGKYDTLSKVTRTLQPHAAEENEVVKQAAIKYLHTTPIKWEQAVERRKREIEKEEKKLAAELRKMERRESAERDFGCEVTNARDAVRTYMKHNGVTVTADLDCVRDGRKIKAGFVEAEILLAAEANGYTLGNDKIMSCSGLKLAFEEYLEARRQECADAIWSQVAGPVDPIRAHAALRSVKALCGMLFAEPEFGFAALQKHAWQTKRRYAGLPVLDEQMIILTGEQRTGKTETARNLLKPLAELATEADCAQVSDDKNFGLRQLASVLLDELAKADRADRNKLKSVITGRAISTRMHYSHLSAKIPIRVTLIGTADRPLHTYISDPAGMRRYVPVQMRRRRDIHIADWHAEVEQLDWQGFWLAIDITTVDPLMSRFSDRLRQTQEKVRLRENIESWLDHFNPLHTHVTNKINGDFIEFGAAELYEQAFRDYEERFHPASHGTPLTTWGATLTDMIDTGTLEGWSYRLRQHKKIYVVDRRTYAGMTNPDDQERPHGGNQLALLRTASQARPGRS